MNIIQHYCQEYYLFINESMIFNKNIFNLSKIVNIELKSFSNYLYVSCKWFIELRSISNDSFFKMMMFIKILLILFWVIWWKSNDKSWSVNRETSKIILKFLLYESQFRFSIIIWFRFIMITNEISNDINWLNINCPKLYNYITF